MNNVQNNGNYWSSSYNSNNNAYNVNFNSSNLNPQNNNNRYNGFSVRLAQAFTTVGECVAPQAWRPAGRFIQINGYIIIGLVPCVLRRTAA